MAKGPGENSRTDICHGVWHVMYTRGVGAVSVRSVAAAAGVSPGRVQHHFPSREKLIHASLEHLIGAAVEVHDERTNDDDPAGQLWHLLAHAVPVTAQGRIGVAVYHSYVALAVTDPVIAEQLARARTGARSELARLITQLSPPGVTGIDAEHLARRLQSAAEGATLGVLLGDLEVEQAHTVLRDMLTLAHLPVHTST